MNLFTISSLLVILSVPCFLSAQTKTKEGIVIHVDDVTPATNSYNDYESEKVLAQAMNKQILVHSDQGQKLIPPSSGGNSFLETIHLAYAQHHDLVLSPDDIWIQIALGVSIHVNQNFDKLHSKVVHSPEKKELAVRLDDLTKMKPDDWAQLIDTFAILAKEKVQPEFHRAMLPEFSTSTPETRTILNVILLSSVKESLEMRAASGCGIPNIILRGEKKDWEKILAHLDLLAQYDLQFWTDELKPIIQEFINAFDGKADRAFWQHMYKYRTGYMLEQMNGWASKFFPYFKESEYIDDQAEMDAYVAENPGIVVQDMLVRTSYYPNPYLKGGDYMLNSIDLWLLPASFCAVPLVWSNFLSKNPEEHEQHLTMHAGFMGSIQNGRMLQNNPSWFIVQASVFRGETDYEEWLSSGGGYDDALPCIWTDKVISDSTLLAIYYPEKNKTAVDGLSALKSELYAHMKQQFPKETLAGTELRFIVTHFGSCINIVVKNSRLSEKAQAELVLYMKKLKHGFQPAVISFNDAESQLEVVENHPEDLPANQQILIVF